MISIIIPVYNEEKNLHNFIYDLYSLYDIKNHEVIFVDGGSSDRTIDILNELSYFGYTYVKCEKKGRANQMNYGAKIANGNIFWFVHADSTLEKDVLDKILKSNLLIGCLKIKFYPTSLPMIINSYSSTRRVKKRNIAFGDQGIFLKKELFNKTNGYKDLPLMEDYELSQTITSLGIKIKVIDSIITTSSRRYKGKIFRTMILMKRLQKMYRNKEDINKIAKKYKDLR